MQCFVGCFKFLTDFLQLLILEMMFFILSFLKLKFRIEFPFKQLTLLQHLVERCIDFHDPLLAFLEFLISLIP